MSISAPLRNFLDIKPPELINDFIARCSRVNPSIDTAEVRSIAIHTIKHLTRSRLARETTREQQRLETRWYQSLAAGEPDFSVYSEPYYLAELFACYSVYSRKHLIGIQNPRSTREGRSIVDIAGRVRGVLDVGCGLGYTTLGLASIYPEARVIGFELPDSTQFIFASKLASERGFNVVSDVVSVTSPIDLIFASEYFEHIVDPVAHANQLIDLFYPKAFLTANSFNSMAIGHFNIYLCGGERVSPTAIGRRFNSNMRKRGYRPLKTRLWNNRPAVWIR